MISTQRLQHEQCGVTHPNERRLSAVLPLVASSPGLFSEDMRSVAALRFNASCGSRFDLYEHNTTQPHPTDLTMLTQRTDMIQKIHSRSCNFKLITSLFICRTLFKTIYIGNKISLTQRTYV